MTTPFIKFKALSLALVSSFVFTQAQAAMVSTGGYNTELHKVEMMHMLDGNADHMVTAQEFNAYYGDVFKELDTNHDGTLDAKEWVGTGGKQEIRLATGGYSHELRKMEMMKSIDADGDHKVSKQEFVSYHQALFKTMDANGDKQLDPQEWLAKQTGN